MTNQIVISSFQWGLANDRNAWQKGAFWDASNIEIRKNSEFITLNRSVEELSFSSASQINAIALTNYNWGPNVENEINAFTADGRVHEISTWEIFKLQNDWIKNLINANGYNYIIWNSYLHKFQNGVRLNVLATNTFSSGWTGTNWSFSSGATHTTGSTVALTQSSPLVSVSWERYHIICDLSSGFTGSLTVSIWGTTSSNLVAGRNDVYLITSTTAGVSFTPSTDYNWTISYVRVDRVSTLSVPDGLWVDEQIATLTSNVAKRPAINFFGDLIIWDGTQVARYNKDWTTYLYSTTADNPVIWGLDGTVYAITQIGLNVYVWCNNGGSTNMYIWDGVSSRPTQKTTIPDKPVINVALLNNQHYWWAEKWIQSQKHVLVWEWYQTQRYITSDIPKALGTETIDDPDRLALYGTNTNAIETFGDIVYFPGYGKLFGFWRYFPGQDIAFNKEIAFNGTECTAMLTTTAPTIFLQDFTFYMLIAYLRSGSYYIGKIDFRDWNGTYASSWFVESMEYTGWNLWLRKNQKKLLVPFYLPHSSTSIKVYERKDQAGSYTLIKTIDTTTYWTGFNVAELVDTGKWNTIQWKFELITSNATYTPRLYVWITNMFLNVEQK